MECEGRVRLEQGADEARQVFVETVTDRGTRTKRQAAYKEMQATALLLKNHIEHCTICSQKQNVKTSNFATSA